MYPLYVIIYVSIVCNNVCIHICIKQFCGLICESQLEEFLPLGKNKKEKPQRTVSTANTCGPRPP